MTGERILQCSSNTRATYASTPTRKRFAFGIGLASLWGILSCSKLNLDRQDSDEAPSSQASSRSSATRASSTKTTSQPGKPDETASHAKVPDTVPHAGGSCDAPCLSIERCERGRCVPSCPESEVYVPKTGPEGFLMGRGEPDEDDRQHRVVLTRPFCMDETEVTVAAYRKCVEAGGCTEPQLRDINANYRAMYNRPNHPVNMVDLARARAYCEHHDKDLPTEAQFEWAAGHGDGRTYPWGNEDPTCDNALADFTPGGAPKSDPAGDVGCHGGGTSPVKAHPKGATAWPDGKIYDLGGNVWEWTRDCSRKYPSEQQTDPNPTTHPRLHGDCWVFSLRGGGWNRSMYALRVHARGAARRNYTVPGLGFRCVRNPK